MDLQCQNKVLFFVEHSFHSDSNAFFAFCLLLGVELLFSGFSSPKMLFQDNSNQFRDFQCTDENKFAFPQKYHIYLH